MADFDFDEWMSLSRSDPEAFERRRQQAIEEMISSASANRQQRLRGLQWRIDMERRKHKDSVQRCRQVFGMMWQSVYGDNGLLQALNSLPEKRTTQKPIKSRAKVLEFQASSDPD